MSNYLTKLLLITGTLAITHCRGRDYAKPMPRYVGTTSDALILFQSADEEYGRGNRIHFIDAISGYGSEIDRKAAESAVTVLKEPHIVFGSDLIGQSGKVARLISKAEEKKRVLAPYTVSYLSPDNAVFMRAAPGAITLARTDGRGEFTLQKEWADCAWLNDLDIICLSGPYQERRAVITYNIQSKQTSFPYQAQGKAKLDNLRIAPGLRIAAFTENTADNAVIFLMDLRTKICTKVADFSRHYIFGLEISAEGVIAARIVSSKHPEGKLAPYDIWISAPFASARSAGYLLNLPALDSPGFFSGKGFLGVDSFAFSPDGKSLAILMSGEYDCRMADEGGNLACRKDIYIVDRDKPELRRLTKLQVQSAERLQWRKFMK